MSFDLSKKSSGFAPGRPERCFEPCIEIRLAGPLAGRVWTVSTDLPVLADRQAVTTRREFSLSKHDGWTDSSSRINHQTKPSVVFSSEKNDKTQEEFGGPRKTIEEFD